MASSPHPTAARLLLAFLLGLGVLAWLWLRPPAPAGTQADLEADAEAPGLHGAEEAVLRADGNPIPAKDPAGASAVADAPRGRPRVVRGIVGDGAGRGIAGASVALFPIDPRGLRGAPYPDGPRLAGTRTDREGAFQIPTTGSGWMRVVASAPGRATVAQRIAGAGVEIRLVLPAAATLLVDVLDDGGRPVGGARVHAHVEDTRFASTADAVGRVMLTTVPPGTARVRVSAPDRGTVAAGPFVLRSGEQTSAIVVLPRGVSIEGIVRDAQSGTAIAGAVLHIAHPGRSEATESTGPDGRFGPVPGGGVGERVFVAAIAEGYAPVLLPVVLSALETLSVEVRMTRAQPWHGTVVDAAGLPVAGAKVSYSADGIAGREPAATHTDAQGRFALPPPPPPAPGRRVILHAEGGAAMAALALRPGSVMPDPLVLTLAEGGAVHGRVLRADGAARGGVQVRLTPAWDQVRGRGNPDAATSRLLLANETGLAGLAGVSAEDGGWIIRGVAPGPYQVRYRWEGGSKWSAQVLEVTGSSTAAGTETLGQGARVSGRVTDRTGQPIAGATLRLGPERDSRRAQRTTSGPDGWFEFVGLAPGPHRLRVSLGALAPQIENVNVEDASEQRVDVQFDDGTTLLGRVIGPDGRPYAGVLRISLHREGRARPDRTPLVTRVQAGRFQLEGVAGGRWLVEARAAGSLRGEAGPVALDAGRVASVSIRLQGAHTLRGVVTTSAGRPSPGATVSLVRKDTGRRHLVTTDRAGTFVLEAVAPGSWQAEFRGSGGAPAQMAFSVLTGAPTHVRLSLLPAGSAQVHLRDERGRPIPQALILFRRPDGGLVRRAPTRSDRAGEAVAHDLPVAHLQVTVRTIDGRRGRAEVDITAGDTAQVEVVVRSGAQADPGR